MASQSNSHSTAADKRAAIAKQIEALQGQMESLNQEAVHEVRLKLSDARAAVRDIEEQLALLTGKPVGAPKARRERRPSITDEALQPQLLKVMANFGKEGMNAVHLAERLHQDPLRIRKFLTANPDVLRREGSGPRTRFHLP